jgi:hypothetical protein
MNKAFLSISAWWKRRHAPIKFQTLSSEIPKVHPVVTIFSKNHELCDICTAMTCEFHKFHKYKNDTIIKGSHHKTPESLARAAELTCYFCGNIYEQIRPREVDHDVMPELSYRFEPERTGITISVGVYNSVHFDLMCAEDEGRENTLVSMTTTESSREDFAYPLETRHAAVLDRASHWLALCLENHLQCQTKQPSPWFPVRLLDVVDNRLITTNEETFGSYNTLSYCWGKSPSFFVLTAQNLSQLTTSISIQELPKVFQDAFVVTRYLGVRYLWIDALCIIQSGEGSFEDWQLQSSQMADVYAHGLVNISASWASRPEDGCFVSRNPGLMSDLQLSIDQIRYRWTANPTTEVWNELKMSPTTSRGWILQERLLSPRILHMGRCQIFWECRGLSHASERAPDLSVDTNTQKFSPFSIPQPDTKDLSMQIAWNRIVSDYTSRSLTRPHVDKLIAFSAIAKTFNDKFQDEYIAGHFRKQLPLSLFWCPGEAHDNGSLISLPRTSEEPFMAPSWSWAAIHGPVLPPDISEDNKCVAEVVNVDFKLVDPSSPFGQLKSASITLRGPVGTVVKSRLVERDEHDKVFHEKYMKVEIDPWWENQSWEKDLMFLWIYSCPSASSYFLVLHDVLGSKPQVFQRVGYAWTSCKKEHILGSGMFANIRQQTITII